MPHKLYKIIHWMAFLSLVILLIDLACAVLFIAIELITKSQFMSDKVFNWFADFFSWSIPCLFGFFVATSSFVVNFAKGHLIEFVYVKDDDKPEEGVESK